MNLNTIDLNLFLVFRAIHSTRSVTAAGERLCMTQSAVSNALRRLRDRFNDPLFVRTPQGMQPTPLAARLIGLVDDGLQAFTHAIDQARSFDPVSSDRRFRLVINDVGHLVMMPRLLARTRELAPATRIETIAASTAQDVRALLLEDGVDMALGSWEPLGAGFHHDDLFEEVFVALLNRDHWLKGDELTLEQYLSAEHIAYRPGGDCGAALDAALASVGMQGRRNVVFDAAHSLGLADIVATTDFVLTAPRNLAVAMCESSPRLRLARLPFRPGAYTVRLQWHQRFHLDGGHQWMRALLTGLFEDLVNRTSPQAVPLQA